MFNLDYMYKNLIGRVYIVYDPNPIYTLIADLFILEKLHMYYHIGDIITSPYIRSENYNIAD